MILTGFSKSLTAAVPELLTNFLLEPVASVDLTQHALVHYFLDMSRRLMRLVLRFCFSTTLPGGHDPTSADYDYSIRGTMTISEVATGTESIATTGAYTRPILVVTGQEDNLSCNLTGLQATPGNCGSGSTGLLAQTRHCILLRVIIRESAYQRRAISGSSITMLWRFLRKCMIGCCHWFLIWTLNNGFA